MSHKETPLKPDVDLVECTLNNSVLMSNLLTSFLTHPEIAEDAKGVCSLTKLNKKKIQNVMLCQHIHLILGPHIRIYSVEMLGIVIKVMSSLFLNFYDVYQNRTYIYPLNLQGNP